MEEMNSYRSYITWGGVNDDRIFIFGLTIPLTSAHRCNDIQFEFSFFSVLYYTNVKMYNVVLNIVSYILEMLI